MKFGISFLNIHPKGFLDLTRAAEELGFESVWLSDHLVFPVDLGNAPYPGAAGDSPGDVVKKTPSLWDRPLFDTTAVLCYLAGQTSSIRLGTYVYVLGIRHPFVAARGFQTLDYLSGGRAEVGIGAGWMDSEFRAADVDFHTRGRRLDECIDVCRRLWTEPQVGHQGEFFSFDPVGFEPKPSPSMRVHVGGESPAALRRAARRGDGWIAMENTAGSLRPKLEKLESELASVGRSRADLEVSVVASVRNRDDVQRWADLGVDRLIMTPWTRSSTAIAELRTFAPTLGLG
ncbi:MAG TPA: TIGR03619 family F420-dependent LLM class oxidoreductase [Pseudonocardia sp.]